MVLRATSSLWVRGRSLNSWLRSVGRKLMRVLTSTACRLYNTSTLVTVVIHKSNKKIPYHFQASKLPSINKIQAKTKYC